ncbi:DUF4170 domain-containing protein [Ochrobactrum haematophilum]|uniref:DUF4170 domain-containing protein n=1 Tax=Brucella haematophila TaxID=419474 RepID=A0ABX1DMF3_9HYPH|nr:DUF4170 domain-containing protein [Brucella haematophila]
MFRDYCHECRRRQKQLLHLVFGGELSKLGTVQFRDLENLDIVGIYPNYESAKTAWKAKAQQTVDNAHMRYFIVHLHRLLDPEGVTLQAD